MEAECRPKSRSGDILGRPRVARSAPRSLPNVPGALRTRSWSVPERMPSPTVMPNALRDLLRSIFDRYSAVARSLRSVFRIGFYSVLLTSDVFRVARSSHEKTSKKQPFRTRKSRPGASRGRADEQARPPKRRRRAKKRARSASGASENLKVSANESISSEKARPEPPKIARGPGDSES